MGDTKVDFGTCKICGGETYNVNGGSFLCKCVNCPAWYTPQEFFVEVRLADGREGFMLRHKVPDDAEVIGE